MTEKHRQSQWGLRGAFPQFFTVILCFEGRFSIENSVILLKSNILDPTQIFCPPNFYVGYVTAEKQLPKKFTNVFPSMKKVENFIFSQVHKHFRCTVPKKV